jgi:hypothetical protein
VNELLARIVEAHGGLDHWRGFNRVEATIVTDGAFWGMKNLTQDQDPRQMTVSLHEERSSVAPFGDPDWHTEFTPDRIAILRSDGTVVAERHDPRASFAGHEKMTPWDPLHRAYFKGYALWTYLTTPFLLTMEGVQVTEAEPWTEGGETWRVLRARFPESIATHSAVQDFFFGDDSPHDGRRARFALFRSACQSLIPSRAGREGRTDRSWSTRSGAIASRRGSRSTPSDSESEARQSNFPRDFMPPSRPSASLYSGTFYKV